MPAKPSARSEQCAHPAASSGWNMRAHDEIGDDAFHQIEEELDWIEMAGQSTLE